MAGQASNPISVNQAPQYGDKKTLQNLKTLTTTPMSGVPTPAPTAGRPQGSTPQGQPAQTGVPPEQVAKMNELATATKVKQYWDRVAMQYPSSWSKMYASDANENYQKVAHELRAGTPFFQV
jgi:hypothetical protein